MSFTIEEIYNCTREEFCVRTGTDMSDMMIRLQKEVTMLELSLAAHREQYRSGGKITEDEQRYRARLIKTIEDKIANKSAKVKDITRYLGNK